MTTGSCSLNSIIQAEIEKAGGFIPFAQFMALALYHPAYGYYNQPRFELGEKGDFTTASELTPLYAGCFAHVISPLLGSLSKLNILELGAGSGKFAGDLLTALKQKNVLPDQYFIYEISPSLRAQQQSRLRQEYPDVANRIQWLETLPTSFSGVLLANEVLDALPIHCFSVQSGKIKERGVSITEGELHWQLQDPVTPSLAPLSEALRVHYELSDGYASEIHLNLIQLVSDLTTMLTEGVMFFADYGYGRDEYYHPERQAGTLTCFKSHRHHANPFMTPGEQDITAHVDFTRVIEAAHANNGSLLGYTSQAAFLLGAGLMDLANLEEETLSEAERFKLHQAIKTLTLPTEMGERIKIMAIAKAFDAVIPAFQLKDRSRDL